MSNKSRTSNKQSTDNLQISPKQRRIIKAKIKGQKNTEIGKVEYPDANPTSQRQMVSTQLKKPNVAQYYEQSKLMALKEHNITWSRIIRPITDALDFSEGKPIDNINVRLKGSKMASEFLESKQMDTEAKEQLLNLPDVDEIQLIRLMKK